MWQLCPDCILPHVNFPFVSGQDRIDMPQINYDMFNGKKYKYFYGTGLFINQHFMNSVSVLPSCMCTLQDENIHKIKFSGQIHGINYSEF